MSADPRDARYSVDRRLHIAQPFRRAVPFRQGSGERLRECIELDGVYRELKPKKSGPKGSRAAAGGPWSAWTCIIGRFLTPLKLLDDDGKLCGQVCCE